MINNNIEEKKCNSEVIELLKSKGFDNTPTQSIAIEWLRINFNIWIGCSFLIENGNNVSWISMVSYIDSLLINESEEFGGYVSPKEAIDDALLYALNNIKKSNWL